MFSDYTGVYRHVNSHFLTPSANVKTGWRHFLLFRDPREPAILQTPISFHSSNKVKLFDTLEELDSKHRPTNTNVSYSDELAPSGTYRSRPIISRPLVFNFHLHWGKALSTQRFVLDRTKNINKSTMEITNNSIRSMVQSRLSISSH